MYGVAPGSFAEYAVAKEGKLARKPANLTFAQAAVVPVSAATALRAARQDVGRARAGTVGAGARRFRRCRHLRRPAGQGPRRRGHRGVRAPRSSTSCPSLGADHVLDYSHARTSPTGPGSTTSSSTSAAARPLKRLRRALTTARDRRVRGRRGRREPDRHGQAAARRCWSRRSCASA